MIGRCPALFLTIILAAFWAGHAQGHQPSRHGPGAPPTRSSGPPVTLELQAKVQGDFPWRFRPDRRVIRVRRGESARVLYRARNLADRPTTGKAVHSVLPDGAEAHLDLLECFCFLQTTLAPGEERTFPLALRLRPTLPRRIVRLLLRYEFAPDQPEGPLAAFAPAPGTLEVWAKATGADVARGRPARLRVVSVGIEGQAKPGLAAWFQLPTSADLVMAEGDGEPSQLLRSAAPAGTYLGLRLQVMASPGIAKEGSTAVLLHSPPVPIPFTILPGEKTILVLDLALREAGGGGYEILIEGGSARPAPGVPESRGGLAADR